MTKSIYIGLLALSLHATAVRADSIEDGFCMTNAKAYDQIVQAREFMTAERMYAAYRDKYIVPTLGREAQEVLRRMNQDNQPMETALEVHIDRYHGNKSAQEVDEIRQTVSAWLEAAEEIRQMIAIYEAPLDFAQAAALMDDDYDDQLTAAYEAHLAAGDTPQSATVKAYVETQNSLELDKGYAGVSKLEPGSPCYKDALFRYESSMRMDRVNASEIGQYSADFLEQVSERPKMPKLQYYTHGYMRADYGTVRGALAAALGG